MDINFKKPSVWIPIIAAVAFATGLLLGSRLYTKETTQGQNKFATVLRYIDDEYVDNVNTDSLIEKQFLMSFLNWIPTLLTFPRAISRQSTKNLTVHSAVSEYSSIH